MATMEQNLTELTPAGPMLTVSDLAANRLLAMMQEKQLDGYALRVFVQGGGCSGLQYGMIFDDETREGDNEFNTAGLRVLVDRVSANYLAGASIDYFDDMMNSGFKIENPNAVSSCGCGHSFRTDEQEGGGASGSAGGCGGGACSQ
ncbi:HesB/IscA family protein [Candidatus Viridilinea mediisalina]|uniref:Iron-sulfur cluster assembly accessory protein n=1 Tax=Candidatus Viridilinea mediisalina TaxID=2024553 RepID=A0A2A6RHQ3_9CHLR|nr:iron-sulfur cluster assembly accessory protein [Candidatus Viridilinea mediisalina]PDW02471.1 iron-sulfur cluster assembly accessory protein [Candidatus Viridilinea mediisalina]